MLDSLSPCFSSLFLFLFLFLFPVPVPVFLFLFLFLFPSSCSSYRRTPLFQRPSLSAQFTIYHLPFTINDFPILGKSFPKPALNFLSFFLFLIIAHFDQPDETLLFTFLPVSLPCGFGA